MPTEMQEVEPMESTERVQSPPVPATRAKLSRRIQVWIIPFLGYWVMRLLGRTLRWQVDGLENLQSIQAAKKRVIYTFWHGRIFFGTLFFRNRGIVVMTSQNRDGEYIARVIRRFGYGAARGSSSRGAKGALVEMVRALRQGKDVAFTIDGPRGPRYVAKPGAVWIAARTGDAIFPFHMSPERSWVFKSWDQFHCPKPFSRVLVLMGKPIYVKEHATEEELSAAQDELQRSLEDLLHRGDSHWRPAIKS
jgi:lysophospholipid acyltransferase (LPLAT)-like uncharacterized protein